VINCLKKIVAINIIGVAYLFGQSIVEKRYSYLVQKIDNKNTRKNGKHCWKWDYEQLHIDALEGCQSAIIHARMRPW
jgi:hypothetical protein